MTKRVYILTLPLGGNYGGIMQAYALQQTLSQLGYDPVTMDISYPRFRPLWKRVRSFVYYSLMRFSLNANKTTRVVQQHTRRFIQQHIARTEPLGSTKQLQTFYRKHPAHAYIVGSDQVWRSSYVPPLDEYFLQFIPEEDTVRRIAYGASFGVSPIDIPVSKIPWCTQLLQRFDAVSAREQSAIEVLQQKFNCDAQWVLDPTMLLTREEYITRLDLNREPSGEIFAYMLDYTPDKEKFVRRLAQSHKSKYQLCNPSRIWSTPGVPAKECIMPPVERWLEGILRAETVVTDSFHGIVFSLIFGRPFIGIINKSRGSDRFQTLIDCLGLKTYEEDGFQIVTLPEDTSHIINTIERYRTNSISFLENALKEKPLN